ncbi:multidrug ABC transporter permease [Methanocella sp. CWC-04]|uniref:Multidrug ABC transporter permease n=1 Tax=Methanooceanicella nereidis TaxID=2052831 RepID=A0AAP2W509_9EURY|nr:ABC transporter permease [Methanocella sp. CWC-04]MCD1294975.1 multidrug ABC transporter permease [Methanocella sp. CWC-04]
MSGLLPGAYSHFERDIKRWIRGRVTIFTSLITPTAWLIFVGLTLPAKFTNDYLNFIAPGILVMTVLFSSLQGGIFLSFDKVLGYLNKFLALPSPRESILFGKVLFIITRSLLQVTIIFTIALLLGAVVNTGMAGMAAIYIGLFLFGCLISSFAITIAILAEDFETYSAINGLISMPLFFASTALMPLDTMPGWLRVLASINPVSHIINAIRALFLGDWGAGIEGILKIALMAIIMVSVSVIIFRKATVD